MNAPEIKKSNLQALLRLQERARNAENIQELAFILTNETKVLVEFRQAILWTTRKVVRALSCVSVVEKDAPFVQWVNQLSAQIVKKIDTPLVISPDTL